MSTSLTPSNDTDARGSLVLRAPVSGLLVPLEQVADEAFAQRLAGDGIAIEPLGQSIVAPCDARVSHVHRAQHAVTLDANGFEILVHVGLDTVKLQGRGFTVPVRAGDLVRAGDVLITFDADFVASQARSLVTPLLVTNGAGAVTVERAGGEVVAGRDVVLRVASATTTAAPTVVGDAITSPPVIVGAASGLHARPAAAIVSAARRFDAEVRITKDGRDANARSLVAIMALEVSGGDTVRIVARGPDARAAIEQLSELLARDLDASHGAAATSSAPPPVSAAEPPRAPDGSLRGVPSSPGLVIGRVVQYRHVEPAVEERAADPDRERRALDAALATARAQLEEMRRRLATAPDRAAIFAAHQELLEDPELLDDATSRLRGGASAPFAWREAYRAQAERLLALRNPLLAARAADLRDVGRRVLHLLVGHDDAPRTLPPDTILVAEDLTPSDAVSLDRAHLRGFCTTLGSATSHVAILARGLGIPAITGIDPRVLELADGSRVVLDGDVGTLEIEPTAARDEEVALRQGNDDRRRREELASAGEHAVTRDGHRIEVVANIGEAADASRVPELGGEGVGLLRTEFLFLDRTSAPTEDEQAETYEVIARALGPDRILVIRALDVGGDKPLAYLPVPAEENPFLGERGIRLLLDRPEVLATQVRAVLRASRVGRVALMFPMISTLAEWRAARAVVERERAALGVAPIQVGIMVETASAALLADRFAAEADFFSIGTNDLTQYTLAMDRGNARLASQLDALHPAVLRLVERTIAGAAQHGRWVGVCGALASDPAAVPVLLGLGVHELSVSLPVVPAIKAQVRSLTLADCRETARRALEEEDGAAVRAIVAQRHG